MVKPMKYRDIEKTLKSMGCTSREGKGDHIVWTCPCGQHKVSITESGTVSPGLVRMAIKRLECLPKGWLQ